MTWDQGEREAVRVAAGAPSFPSREETKKRPYGRMLHHIASGGSFRP